MGCASLTTDLNVKLSIDRWQINNKEKKEILLCESKEDEFDRKMRKAISLQALCDKNVISSFENEIPA